MAQHADRHCNLKKLVTIFDQYAIFNLNVLQQAEDLEITKVKGQEDQVTCVPCYENVEAFRWGDRT